MRRHRTVASREHSRHQSLRVRRVRTWCCEYPRTHPAEPSVSRPVSDGALPHAAGNELTPADQAMLAGSQLMKSRHLTDPLFRN